MGKKYSATAAGREELEHVRETAFHTPRSVEEEEKEVLQAPEQRFPCSSWRSMVEQIFTCSPWRTP